MRGEECLQGRRVSGELADQRRGGPGDEGRGGAVSAKCLGDRPATVG